MKGITFTELIESFGGPNLRFGGHFLHLKNKKMTLSPIKNDPQK